MSIDRSVAVGVEIGGGQAAVALIDRHGRVRRRCLAKTLRARPVAATLEPYLRAIDTMLAAARMEGLQVCGIGVSVPGTIDYTTRRPLLVSLLPALNSFPLCDFLATRYHLPTCLHADVDAAVQGEYRFGAGQGFHRLFFLTVNAVVGAALVVNGELVQSEQQYIGHICHLPITTAGLRCSCGKRGCINTLVSIDAMQRMVQRALRRGDETTLAQRFLNHEYFSLQLLAEEAARGDSVAVGVYSEVGRWLGAALTRYVDLYEPDVLILGGGILHAGDLLLTPVRTALNAGSARSSSRVCSMVEVVPASLGRDVALIGAVAQLF